MSQITVVSFARFREMFGGTHTITTENDATVLSALLTFADAVPQARAELFAGETLRGHVILMYNRERIDADEAADISVRDGDEIVLYPPVSGG